MSATSKSAREIAQPSAPDNPCQTPPDLARALTALRLNTEEILRHKQELEQLNGWFEIALDNMARGLSMFDAEQRLIVCNRMYREIYRLPPELTRPGTPLADIVRFHVRRETGSERLEDIQSQRKWIEQHMLELAQGKTFSYVQELKGGRIILVTNQPIASGGWVDLQEDITEKRHAEEKICWLARHDALTEIPNRFHFREKLEHALEELAPGGALALLWLDLDKFKLVNDTLGHPVGDLLLKSVAERLRATVRGPDLIGRLGGDEFAVLQGNSRRKCDAEGLANRVLRAIRAPHHIGEHILQIDASIGIAHAPQNGRTIDDLLKNVDIALYKAKSRGGGCFAFFERGEDEKFRERHQLEADLKLALGRQELELHYQPIINVKTNAVTSFEALMRWFHPKRGLIAPADFIPIAEQTDMIVPIGEWALRQACKDAVTWPESVNVTVNLSPLQVEKGDVVQAAKDALEQSGLPASRLELEITEAVLIGDSAAALDVLRRLHELGVQIALDDFGNAFASLSYLQSFPFDKIKIDRTFVRDIPGRADCVAIVEAVTSLAHNLRMDTVAEGIETREHLASVSAAGCDEAQCYFFSRPVPASQVSEVLALCRIKGLVSNHKAATHHRARIARRRRSLRARTL